MLMYCEFKNRTTFDHFFLNTFRLNDVGIKSLLDDSLVIQIIHPLARVKRYIFSRKNPVESNLIQTLLQSRQEGDIRK